MNIERLNARSYSLLSNQIKLWTKKKNGFPKFDWKPNQAKNSIAFNELVSENSFWKSQDVKENDILKSINGEALTLQNAQKLITGMYSWESGQDIEVEIERDGEVRTIKTTLTTPTSLAYFSHSSTSSFNNFFSAIAKFVVSPGSVDKLYNSHSLDP